MKKIILPLILTAALNAGVYTQDLIKCMVQNSTPQDIQTLKKWIFIAFAQDEEFSKYVNIPQKDKIEINKKMGEYVTRLLTQKCPKELKYAVKYEGAQAISSAFKYLGSIAGSSLTSSEGFKNFSNQFINYVDKNRLNSVIK